MYYAERIGGVVAVVGLLAATWISVRLARADALFRARDPFSVERASALAPGNTEYLLFRALQADYNGADPTPLLERAAKLNPLSSTPRIRLGLAWELHGDFGMAQAELLSAARVDRQFEPKWTLANFYFRQGDTARFWTWMRASLEVSYGDRRPAFDLCWRMSADASEILSRAIPDRQEVLGKYLGYLLETRRVKAMAPVAMKLAEARSQADQRLLLAVVDTLIDAGEAADAASVWRMMGYPLAVTFEAPRVGAGFDWRLVESTGVAHITVDQPRAMHRITLNGSEAETCDLLKRIDPLQQGAKYVLRWEARTQGLGSPTGLTWRIGGERGPVAASENGSVGVLAFTAASDLTPLTLVYQRPAGEARADGSLELWNVRIEKATSSRE